MNTAAWSPIIQLIARYGIEWVAGLIDIATRHKNPTKEALAEILALSQKPMDQYLEEAKARLAKEEQSTHTTPPA